MHVPRWLAAALLLGAALVVAGCARATDAGAGSSVRSGPTSPPVDGIKYLSTSVTGRDLVAGTRIELTVNGGNVSASAGCNSVFGPVRIQDGRMSVPEPLGMTAMGCLTPGQGEQDSWLMSFLQDGPALAVAGDGFTLTGSGVSVTLSPQQPAALTGTVWELTTISKDGVSQGWADLAAPRIAINGELLTFNTGCNTGSGPVTVSGQRLTIGPLASTRRACVDDTVGKIEQTMLATLSGQVDFHIAGSQLTLERADTALTFRSAIGDLTPAPDGGIPSTPSATSASQGSSAPASVGIVPPSERVPMTSMPVTTNSLNRQIPEPPPTHN